MSRDDDKSELLPKRLLEDDDFADAILGDYERQGEPVDRIAQQRVWQRLHEKRGKGRGKTLKRNWWMAGTALAAAVAATVWFRVPMPDLEPFERSKGGSVLTFVPLSIKVNTSQDTYRPAAHTDLEQPQRFAFYVRAVGLGNVALVIAPSPGQAVVVPALVSTAADNTEQLVSTYQIQQPLSKLVACAIAAPTAVAVAQAAQTLVARIQAAEPVDLDQCAILER